MKEMLINGVLTTVVDGKIYVVCPDCQQLVRINKPVVGSLHFCVHCGKDFSASSAKEGTLERRKEVTGGDITDLGGGYYGLVGHVSSTVAYIELPEDHPDIGKDYNDLSPDVNGGLTFGAGRVYGWDYGHAYNTGTPSGDMQNALRYFKEREKKRENE